jgi:anti-sigma factor RsiW
MCEFSEKLVAWLDRELPAEEFAEVERHLEVCAECRSRVDAYKRVSADFDAYCENALASSARRRTNPLTAVAAGAAAALAALFLIWPKTQVRPLVVNVSPQIPVTSAAVAETAAPSLVRRAPVLQQRSEMRPARARVKHAAPAAPPAQNASFVAQEPVIQISIPADEMFPPGAVPQGMHFIADVTISPDGSAERLRLRPRLAGYERSTVEP